MKEYNINQRSLIFLLVSIGLITLPHINHIPLSLFCFFFLLLFWRFIGAWKASYLPKKWLVFVLTLLALFLLYSQHNGVLGRDAGTSLFITALALKLLEIKQERDLYLINYLAFIVASTQFLYQQSIVMSLYILFVCCVLLASLISINSQKPDVLVTLKSATLIIFQAVPISIVLFVLFPRIEAPRWMLFDQSHSAKSGLSDTMEPGSISQLGLSDELVFRVKFEGDIPPPKQRYWRGPVFSKTNGKKWTETNNFFFAKYLDKPKYTGKPYHYTLMMEPQDKHWVFALDMASSYPTTLSKNGLHQLINNNNPRAVAEYKITSYPKYNTGYITKMEYWDNLQIPGEPSDKIIQLVKQLNGFDQPAEVFIQSLLRHFSKENFHYTLMPPLMQENPIETFLFETRYGFCSHYATAFVYLMRVAGIPARVVGGYQGGELNKRGGFLEIRQANAHAWTEVWLPKKGWTRFDPTAAIAPNRIEQDVNIDLQISTGTVNFSLIHLNSSQTMTLLKSARQLWSNVDYNWQRWVINYTGDNQSKLLSSWGIKDFKSMAYWLFSCITFITVLLSIYILKSKQAKVDKVLLLYQSYCKKLAKVGFDKKTAETATDFSRRIIKQHPEWTDSINKITAYFIKLRYEKNITAKDFILLKSEIARFKTK